MQDSNQPQKFPAIWAYGVSSPYITPGGIPTTSQQGVKNGAASLQDGYPPNCFVPIAAGGAGPFGADFNAITNQVTAGLQWLQAVGGLPYDAAFSIAIGGYPKGAVVASATFPGRWLSTIDNNTSNPDTGGANWVYLQVVRYISLAFGTSQSWSIPAPNIYVRLWGAGGGGGGCSANSSGTGGGGGGYSEGLVTGLTVGGTIPITIGAGGAGGGSGGGNGGIGGTTSFGSYMSSTGGNAGAGNGSLGGSPGVGTGGTLNYSGTAGSYPIASAGTFILAGIGGSSYCGTFNTMGAPAPSGGGTAGQGTYPGVGGNGAATVSGSATGGTGANGLVLVSW